MRNLETTPEAAMTTQKLREYLGVADFLDVEKLMSPTLSSPPLFIFFCNDQVGKREKRRTGRRREREYSNFDFKDFFFNYV